MPRRALPLAYHERLLVASHLPVASPHPYSNPYRELTPNLGPWRLLFSSEGEPKGTIELSSVDFAVCVCVEKAQSGLGVDFCGAGWERRVDALDCVSELS